MSKNTFQTSKAALGFAAVTLISAVSLVGTSDNSGMLPQLAQRFGAKPAAQPTEAPAETEAPPPPAKKTVSGWYDTPQQPPVFGNFTSTTNADGTAPEPLTPGPTSTAPNQAPQTATGSKAAGGPMNAPLSPTAIRVN